MSSLLPQDCIGFHRQWLEGGDSRETPDDLDTRDIIKALIGLHYEITQSETDGILLSLLDRLNRRTNNSHRLQQIALAKDLIQDKKLSIVDAIFLIFSREELVAK